MHQNKVFFAILTILTCFLYARGADKYTDENRPYEFGFNIDGEQHRHEKKDENGLIMGEFGFITADGVYHVTVYATDENGNFKILSMKNLRVKPYPTAPVKKGHSLPFPPSQQPVVSQGPSVQELKPISIEPPGKACSHCSLPTTSTQAPQLTDLAVVSRDDQVNRGPNYNSNQNNQYNTPGINAGNPDQNGISQNYPQYPDNYPQQNYPQENYPQQNYPQQNYPQESDVPPGYSQQESISEQNSPQQEYPNEGDAPYPGQNLQPPRGSPSGERNPKQFDGFSQQPGVGPQSTLQGDINNGLGSNQGGQNAPNKPILISAQMQIVDKNTDIYHRGPGEREGLPNGLTKNDMMLLLYTFNYTVGFHAHHEEGYTNGVKKGYYYVTGRNGVRTRIDYVADDTGFHPKISQEVLDLLSEEVPKPDTEKDERYGLKGYEFKWLYYPPDSKRR